MAYLDRSSRNWGVMIATALAVPAAMIWSIFVFVGGSLVCASVDAACGPRLVDLLAGLAAIAGVAAFAGWLLNRTIEWLGRRLADQR